MRFVDEDRLLGRLRRELGGAVPEAFVRWLAKQPAQPELVGSSAAAEILGVQKPHVTRLRRQGRMPAPVKVEGSNDVYVRSEVVALAAELERERSQRLAKGTTNGG